MLKKLLMAAAFLAAPAAHAQTWFAIDNDQGQCEVFAWEGMTSPFEVMAWVNANGGQATSQVVPLPPTKDNPTGSNVQIVDIRPGEGQEFTIPFFSSADDCMLYAEKKRLQGAQN